MSAYFSGSYFVIASMNEPRGGIDSLQHLATLPVGGRTVPNGAFGSLKAALGWMMRIAAVKPRRSFLVGPPR